jgi:ribosomal protein S18 acetylase RimI-like enzyme
MIEENIFNLTQLWRLGGQSSGCFLQVEGVSMSTGSTGDWPNKLWIEGDITKDKLIQAQYLAKDKKLRLAYWNLSWQEDLGLIADMGFQKVLVSTGMSLELQKVSFFNEQRLRLIPVENKQDAEKWALLFVGAFGYHIPPSTILSIHKEVSFYLVESKGELVGTAMIFIDSKGVAGIYSLGISPAFRRQGLANLLFESILWEIKCQGAEKTILQASSMGLGLYLKYGFQEDFKIEFFELNKKSS